MNDKLDTLIIADTGGYENVAFALDHTNLHLNNETMTIQNLKKRFFSKNHLPLDINDADSLNYEMTGKLNGIYLYDYCSKNGLKCALINEIWPNERRFIKLLEKGPRSIALSTTWLINIEQVNRVVSFIRSLTKDIPIIVGGPLVYNSYLLYRSAGNNENELEPASRDYFFLNENPEYYEGVTCFIIEEQGEETLVRVINALKEDRELSGINNLAYRENGTLRFTERKAENRKLDANIISWHTLDEELLPAILPLRTSSGCLSKCEFCAFVHCRPFRYKKKDALDEEVRRIASRNAVKHIRVVDDNMYPKQIKDLSQAFLENKVEIPWTTFVRADLLDQNNISLLKKAGCRAVQLGLESGDNSVLAKMNKNSSAESYLETIELLNRAGINMRASFILGFPGEDEKTVNNTIDFINSIPTSGDGLFDFSFAPFILVPLSPIFGKENRGKYGLQGYFFDWKHSTMEMADVPKYLEKIFLSIRGDRFFVYTADPIDPELSIGKLKKIKRTRQSIQQAKIAGKEQPKIDALWEKLEKLFVTS